MNASVPNFMSSMLRHSFEPPSCAPYGGLGTKKSGEHQSHYDVLSGNLKCLFGANSSSWCRDISVDKWKILSCWWCSRKRQGILNAAGSPESVWFLLWGSWMSEQHFIVVRSILWWLRYFSLEQSDGRTNWQTLLRLTITIQDLQPVPTPSANASGNVPFM